MLAAQGSAELLCVNLDGWGGQMSRQAGDSLPARLGCALLPPVARHLRMLLSNASPAILPLLQAATGSPRRLQAWFASWHSTPVRPLPALPAAARQPASHRLLHATINTAWHVPGLERWVHFTASHPD